jgi:hypothetical protein
MKLAYATINKEKQYLYRMKRGIKANFIMYNFLTYKEQFEDTKRLIRILNRRRTDSTMAKRKSTKGQTTINKTYI